MLVIMIALCLPWKSPLSNYTYK